MFFLLFDYQVWGKKCRGNQSNLEGAAEGASVGKEEYSFFLSFFADLFSEASRQTNHNMLFYFFIFYFFFLRCVDNHRPRQESALNIA